MNNYKSFLKNALVGVGCLGVVNYTALNIVWYDRTTRLLEMGAVTQQTFEEKLNGPLPAEVNTLQNKLLIRGGKLGRELAYYLHNNWMKNE